MREPLQAFVGHGAPQEVGQPRGELEIVEPAGGRTGGAFDEVDEALRAEHRQERAPDRGLEVGAGGDSLFENHRRGPGWHVHCSRSDCGAAHGNSRARNFLRYEYGFRDSGSSAGSCRSSCNRRTREGPIYRAFAGCVATNRRGEKLG